MLNNQTIQSMNNFFSNSSLKYSISKNSLINTSFQNENTASKNIFLTKRTGVNIDTRNALAEINSSYILKKSDLSNLSLIGQFDKKFLIFYRLSDCSIIFFDQHAVHERVLYEYYQELLFNEFFNDNKNKNCDYNEVKLNLFNDIYGKYNLKKPIEIKNKTFGIEIKKFNDSFLFQKNLNKQNFLGFSWEYSKKNDLLIFFAVPIIFDKIHKIEVLLEIFGNIINNINDFMKCFKNKEKNVLKYFDNVIKSKACRNAIKFNDQVDSNFIKLLIKELSLCDNPFLCAHGRHNYFIKYKL